MSNNDTNIDFEEINGAGASDIESNGVEKLQSFIEKNKNAVLGGLGVLVLLIVGGFYYKTVMMPEAEMSANADMFNAEYLFEQDSFALALNSVDGFLEVIDNHSGTKAANLAHYYAGICYFNLANYSDAIDQLKSFSTSDDVLGSLALGVLADAQMENGNVDDALSSYKKSANFSDNEASAPVLLKKAGLAFELNGDANQAFTFYTKIKMEFPNSDAARDIDKFIGRAEAKL